MDFRFWIFDFGFRISVSRLTRNHGDAHFSPAFDPRCPCGGLPAGIAHGGQRGDVPELAPRRRNPAPRVAADADAVANLRLCEPQHQPGSLRVGQWKLGCAGRAVDSDHRGVGAAAAVSHSGRHRDHRPRGRSGQQRPIVLVLGQTPAAPRALFLPARPILRQLGPSDLAGRAELDFRSDGIGPHRSRRTAAWAAAGGSQSAGNSLDSA